MGIGFISIFLLKARVLNLTISKQKPLRLPLKVCLLFGFTRVFVAFHPRTVKRIVTALMPSLLFRCFSLFLPHLRTLSRKSRSENCLRFGTGGPSLSLYPLLSRNIIFCPALTMAARAKKTKKFWPPPILPICSRHQRERALSRF